MIDFRPETNRLDFVTDIRPSCRVTVGDQALAVVGPRICNSLHGHITSAPLLSVFRRKLKTHAFYHLQAVRTCGAEIK